MNEPVPWRRRVAGAATALVLLGMWTWACGWHDALARCVIFALSLSFALWSRRRWQRRHPGEPNRPPREHPDIPVVANRLEAGLFLAMVFGATVFALDAVIDGIANVIGARAAPARPIPRWSSS